VRTRGGAARGVLMNRMRCSFAVSVLCLGACGGVQAAPEEDAEVQHSTPVDVTQDTPTWTCVLGCFTVHPSTGEAGRLVARSTTADERAQCGAACTRAHQKLRDSAEASGVTVTFCNDLRCSQGHEQPDD